jgi:hypothetical protein
VAKTRRGSRKSSSSKRSKAKGGATKRRKAPRKAPAKPKGVELRPVRQRIRSHVATLTAVEQPSDKVRDSIDRLNRVLDEMDAICGPDMLIPIP